MTNKIIMNTHYLSPPKRFKSPDSWWVYFIFCLWLVFIDKTFRINTTQRSGFAHAFTAHPKQRRHRNHLYCNQAGRREGEQGWILKFDIFLLQFLSKKGRFLSFEVEKWKFTIFGTPWKNIYGYLGKKPLLVPRWKKSFRRPWLQLISLRPDDAYFVGEIYTL